MSDAVRRSTFTGERVGIAKVHRVQSHCEWGNFDLFSSVYVSTVYVYSITVTSLHAHSQSFTTTRDSNL